MIHAKKQTKEAIEMKKFRIYIGGIGGVGKTAVGQELARRHQMKHLSGSQIMMELCGVDSREELSRVPKEQKMAIEKIEYPHFATQYPRVIIDGHCDLLPEQAECFDGFVFLTAPAKIIKIRREQRKGRQRDVGIRTIRTEQNEYQQRVSKTEQECRIKFVTVSNVGSIDETCGLIEKVLKFSVREQNKKGNIWVAKSNET